MKINSIYIAWIVALIFFVYVGRLLKEQSGNQLFGIAETEGQTLKVDFAATVKKSYTRVGAQVKKGDTLFLLSRTELDEQRIKREANASQLNTEQNVSISQIDKEIDLFKSRQEEKMSELKSKIQLLQKEISIQNTLKQAIGATPSTTDSSVKQTAINAAEEAMRQVQLQTIAELQVFENQKSSKKILTIENLSQVKNDLIFIEKEKGKLLLIAPFDGFVEQLFVSDNEQIQSYKDLVKINPFAPNKIIGFIHESINIQYRLGDTLLLTSATRPTVTSKAVLMGASPKLVELPFRLRKYAEIKAWGREIYLNLPAQNNFFIGEKILIKMQ